MVALPLLGSLVVELLISDLPHLLWIAVLDVEGVLAFEEDISRELFRCLALILLLKIDKGLLSARDHHHLGDLSLTGSREIDPELFFSGTWGEVLNKQTEEHDRLLVFEVVHLELGHSL